MQDYLEYEKKWHRMSPFVLIPVVFTSPLPVKPQAVGRIYLIALSNYVTE